MVLKDWKIWLNNKTHIIWINKNKDSEHYNSTIDYFKREKEMEIIEDEKRVLLKTFKTKIRAFKFAKSYMRKH
jgi:hypothetical protein